MMRRPQRSTRFPYTPLFRSLADLVGGPAHQLGHGWVALQRVAEHVGADPRVHRHRHEADEVGRLRAHDRGAEDLARRSEEHTSELQSRQYLVCRLLLEKKKN